MAFLGKKEIKEIKNDLKGIIANKLLEGFKDRRERPVIEVEAVTIFYFEFDEENSDRDKIIITTVNSTAHVWVSISNDGSKSNDNFQLRNTKPITFSYDDELRKYIIQDEDDIFFNISPY